MTTAPLPPSASPAPAAPPLPAPSASPAPSPSAASWRRWPFGGRSGADLLRASLHLLLDLPVAIAGFVVTVVLGTLAFGLLPVYPLALAVLTLWVVAVRGLAAVERRRIRLLLGYDVATPPGVATAGSWHRRLWGTALHRTTWRAVAYHLIRLPLGILTFAVTVWAWAFVLGLIAAPLSLIDGGPLIDPWGALPLLVTPLIGLALLPMVAATVDALATFDAALAVQLLGPSKVDRDERRIEQLATTRSELVDIAEQERRRIERDLHDGAGQQLVSLAMTLGMAREKLDGDPAGARALIDEAHAEAKRALVGLREIVRGISPAILTDRGLGAALSAVAARSVVPVTLIVDVPERPDAATEGIAYYVVCEAIGNAIRHAEPTRIAVTLTRTGDVLDVEVRDDGHGGADPRRGTGLRGLAGRVAAVDGDLHVTSPPGGPTVVHARLPVRDPDAAAAEAG